MGDFALPNIEDLFRVEDLYHDLFSREWKDKAIWENIRDGVLTSAPCLVGKQFNAQKTKVMVVGRAVNGWEVEFDDCSSIDAAVNNVLTQENRMDDFATDWIIDEHGKKYHYAKSPFLRMMRQLVGAFTGTEENWQQRLAWSNLFKVAPRNGGNPSWLMVRSDIPLYCKIIREEINQNRPDVVVFVTETSFFDPYPQNKSFSSFLDLIHEIKLSRNPSAHICMAGDFVDHPEIKLIVCKRPERRPIAEMVADILAAYIELSSHPINQISGATL